MRQFLPPPRKHSVPLNPLKAMFHEMVNNEFWFLLPDEFDRGHWFHHRKFLNFFHGLRFKFLMLLFLSVFNVNAQIVADFVGLPPACAGELGQIKCISITGGTQPYNCQVNCGSCFRVGNIWYDVAPGTYTVTITDSSTPMLTYSNSVIVGDAPYPVPLTISPVFSPSGCSTNSGSICVTVGGGSGSFSYGWQNNNQPATTISTSNCVSGVPAGEYRLQVIDNVSNCSASWNLVLAQATLTLASSVTPSSCVGGDCAGNSFCSGSIALTPTGVAPYTVVWSDGLAANSLSRTNLCPGTYTSTVTDANGCSATSTNTVTLSNAQLLPTQVPSGATALSTLNGVAGFPSGASTHFITTNTVWNPSFFGGLNTINTACNIVVMPGAQLTISGLVMKMPQGSTIRVMPQGRLLADNSTFEPGCGSTWRGFEVFGVNATNSTGRGYLEVVDCKITSASIGVTNFQFDPNLVVPLPFPTNNAGTTAGGRVKAVNTQFIDNIVDVHLAQIALDSFNGNSGEFTNCLFSINLLPLNCNGVNYTFQSMARGRVLLNYCQNVVFTSCVFENTNPSNMGAIGNAWNFPCIRTNSSSFTIDGSSASTPDGYTSKICGFRRGIVAFKSFAPGYLPPFTIDRVSVSNTLFKCFNGIDANGLKRSTYSNNWLTDLPAGFTHLTNNSTTLASRFLTQLQWSAGEVPSFIYERNTHVNVQTEIACAGLLVLNGGPLTNYVVGNYFSGMSNAGGIGAGGLVNKACALIFSGQNRAGTVGTGVRYECNIFENNLFDTFITWSGSIPWSLTGPASKQRGSWPVGAFLPTQLVSAGNKFINSMSIVNQDDITYTTAADAQPLFGNGVCEYWYHPSELNANDINEMTPSYSWPLSVITQQGFQNQCLYVTPVANSTLVQQNDLVETLVTNKQEIELLTSNVTPNDVLIASSSEQIWCLYENMISNRGQISDEALVTLSEKLSFPMLLLLDILSFEAGAGRSERLLNVLKMSGRQFSSSDWNAIVESKLISSEKTEMGEQLSDAKSLFDGQLWKLTLADYEQWESEIMQGNSSSLQLNSIAAYAADRLFAFGQNLLPLHEEIIQKEKSELNMLMAWEEYKDWQEFRLEVLQREGHALTTDEVNALWNYYYEDPTFKGVMAYCLLNEFGDFDEQPYRFASDGREQRSMVKAEVAEEKAELFEVYPNPCVDYISVHSDNFVYFNTKYVVRSLDGRIVLTGEIGKNRQTFILDTSDLQTGVYQLEVTFSNARATTLNAKFVRQ